VYNGDSTTLNFVIDEFEATAWRRTVKKEEEVKIKAYGRSFTVTLPIGE
jgi:hypothetical protein